MVERRPAFEKFGNLGCHPIIAVLTCTQVHPKKGWSPTNFQAENVSRVASLGQIAVSQVVEAPVAVDSGLIDFLLLTYIIMHLIYVFTARKKLDGTVN